MTAWFSIYCDFSSITPVIVSANSLNYNDIGFVIECTDALPLQGNRGNVWLSNSAVWGEGICVSQDVSSWESSRIVVSCVPGLLSSGECFLWIDTDGGVHSVGYSVEFTASPLGWHNLVELNSIPSEDLVLLNNIVGVSSIVALNDVIII